MIGYRFKGAERDLNFRTIYASYPATADTWIVYVEPDGTFLKTPVLFWGLVADGSPVPIAMGGPWDGVIEDIAFPSDRRVMFVQMPDGLCLTEGDIWPNLRTAVDAVMERRA